MKRKVITMYFDDINDETIIKIDSDDEVAVLDAMNDFMIQYNNIQNNQLKKLKKGAKK